MCSKEWWADFDWIKTRQVTFYSIFKTNQQIMVTLEVTRLGMGREKRSGQPLTSKALNRQFCNREKSNGLMCENVLNFEPDYQVC